MNRHPSKTIELYCQAHGLDPALHDPNDRQLRLDAIEWLGKTAIEYTESQGISFDKFLDHLGPIQAHIESIAAAKNGGE